MIECKVCLCLLVYNDSNRSRARVAFKSWRVSTDSSPLHVTSPIIQSQFSPKWRWGWNRVSEPQCLRDEEKHRLCSRYQSASSVRVTAADCGQQGNSPLLWTPSVDVYFTWMCFNQSENNVELRVSAELQLTADRTHWPVHGTVSTRCIYCKQYCLNGVHRRWGFTWGLRGWLFWVDPVKPGWDFCFDFALPAQTRLDCIQGWVKIISVSSTLNSVVLSLFTDFTNVVSEVTHTFFYFLGSCLGW